MDVRAAPFELAARALSPGGTTIRDAMVLTRRPGVISFAGGLPASEFLDPEGIAKSYAHVLSQDSRRLLQYSSTEGDGGLREVIAARLSRQGLPTGPGDLLVTTGATQGLILLATAILDPGDVVLVEDPTFMGALECFHYAGVRAVPVPTDDQGIQVEALGQIASAVRPRMLYVVPNFQNPTGHTLSAGRRAAVASLAARHGFRIVEDDPYGELRFRGERVPWITSWEEAADRGVLMGSLSKTLAPGLRMGWLRAPAELREACVLAKQAFDLHSPGVDQAAAAHYLSHNDLDARLVPVRAQYGRRLAALLEALPAALPEGSTWSRPDGGMFVWVRLPDGYDAFRLLPHAVAHGVAYMPGVPFYAGAVDPATLRLSFATHAPRDIEKGLSRLAEVFRHHRR